MKSSCPAYKCFNDNWKASSLISIKILPLPNLSSNSSSPRLRITTNNSTKSSTNTRKESSFRLGKSTIKITLLLLIWRRNSSRQLRRLNPWRRIFFNHGRILFLWQRNTSIGLLLMHMYKSCKFINQWLAKANPYHKSKSVDLTLSTPMLHARLWKKVLKLSGRTSRNRSKMKIMFLIKKTQIWPNTRSKAICLRIPWSICRRTKNKNL